MFTDLALLALRATTGSLLAGHGAQKLFGSFGGPGLEGAAGMFESIGLKPGRLWATVGGAAEFGGGALTALGLLNPLGPLAIISVMTMAWLKAHRGKPIWVTSGGAELPLTNIAVALAV
ncbi:MAG TPA: DoxX family protein, partial [Candidatus Tectomicrobia bacterium]|nr:DoxX family protein [Candidatus Tectomicrobia bacterium]